MLIQSHQAHPLKAIIVGLGFRQWDVAVTAGISPGRLNRILNGRVTPHESELRNLRRVLGIEEEKSQGKGENSGIRWGGAQ